MVWTFWQRSSFWGTNFEFPESFWPPLLGNPGKDDLMSTWYLPWICGSVTQNGGFSCLSNLCKNKLKLTIWEALFQRVDDGIFASHMWTSSLQSLSTPIFLFAELPEIIHITDFFLYPFFFFTQPFDFLSITPVICQFCFLRAFKFVWCVMNTFFLMFCDRTFLG